MERNSRIRELAIAERLVAQGNARIARQRSILQQLTRDGQDTAQAAALLAVLEELQQKLVTEQERLRRDCAAT